MARIRTIKPQFWSDAAIVSLPFEYRLLFQGLWNFADDHGFIENHPVQIKLNVFPADNVDIAKGIRALKKAELIDVVNLRGKSVIHILNWKKHQRVEKPQPSQYADAYAEYQAQHAIPGTFQERSGNVPAGREGKGREGKGREVTQVGGGGYVSSAAPNEPPPPVSTLDYKPWRCAKHQEVDVACYDCKDAKAAWKAQQAAEAKAAKEAKRQADLEARRQREAEEAATVIDPDAGKRVIEEFRKSRKGAA